MPTARKLTSTRRTRTGSPSTRGVLREYELACRVLGFDSRSLFQTLLFADGLAAKQMDVPTPLITRAGVNATRPDVTVRVREYSSGGLLMHFISRSRIRNEDLPHPVRTIVLRRHEID